MSDGWGKDGRKNFPAKHIKARPMITGARPIKDNLKGSVFARYNFPAFTSPFSSIVGNMVSLPVGTRRIEAMRKCDSSWTIVPGKRRTTRNPMAIFLLLVNKNILLKKEVCIFCERKKRMIRRMEKRMSWMSIKFFSENASLPVF